jgi:hypothetical protein
MEIFLRQTNYLMWCGILLLLPLEQLERVSAGGGGIFGQELMTANFPIA